jgi:hypothetical protein
MSEVLGERVWSIVSVSLTAQVNLLQDLDRIIDNYNDITAFEIVFNFAGRLERMQESIHRGSSFGRQR